jgi:hypothetical protein
MTEKIKQPKMDVQIIDPLLICYFLYNIFMYPVHQLLMFYLIPIMETNKLDYWFLKK